MTGQYPTGKLPLQRGEPERPSGVEAQNHLDYAGAEAAISIEEEYSPFAAHHWQILSLHRSNQAWLDTKHNRGHLRGVVDLPDRA